MYLIAKGSDCLCCATGVTKDFHKIFVDQVSRLERKLAEVEEQLHIEMTAKDEIEHEQK